MDYFKNLLKLRDFIVANRASIVIDICHFVLSVFCHKTFDAK